MSCYCYGLSTFIAPRTVNLALILFHCITGGDNTYTLGQELEKTEELRFDSWKELNSFLFLSAPRQSLGTTKLPNERLPEALSQAVKRPECDADHSPPSTAEYKVAWSHDSIPACTRIFAALWLIKHRDKFIVLPSHTHRMFGLYYIKILYCEDMDQIPGSYQGPVAASCEQDDKMS